MEGYRVWIPTPPLGQSAYAHVRILWRSNSHVALLQKGELVLAEIWQPHISGVVETTKQEVHGRPEPVAGVLDLFRGLRRPHIAGVCSISSIEVGSEFRVCVDDELEEGPVLMRVPRVNVQPTLKGHLIFEIHLLWALKLWRHGPERNQSCLGHDGQDCHVFEPLDLEAILEVDGGKVFEQLEHIDVDTETVN